MTLFIDIISWVFLFVGCFLCITGGVGILRFPDFFTRMHAAGVTDTFGSGFILIGLMALATGHHWLVMLKLIFVFLFSLLTNPTSSHALAKAALHSGLQPQLGKPEEKNNLV